MSHVCYIYTSPPLCTPFLSQAITSFTPSICHSASTYTHHRVLPGDSCVRSLLNTLTLWSILIYFSCAWHTHTRTVDWEIKRRLLMQVVKTKSHIVYIVTVQRKVKRNRLSVSRLARCYIRRLHHAQQSHWKVIFCHVDVSPYGRTGVRGEYVRNLSPLYRSGASYFCLSRPLWWNSGGLGERAERKMCERKDQWEKRVKCACA